jgi:hypothetical protein
MMHGTRLHLQQTVPLSQHLADCTLPQTTRWGAECVRPLLRSQAANRPKPAPSPVVYGPSGHGQDQHHPRGRPCHLWRVNAGVGALPCNILGHALGLAGYLVLCSYELAPFSRKPSTVVHKTFRVTSSILHTE